MGQCWNQGLRTLHCHMPYQFSSELEPRNLLVNVKFLKSSLFHAPLHMLDFVTFHRINRAWLYKRPGRFRLAMNVDNWHSCMVGALEKLHDLEVLPFHNKHSHWGQFLTGFFFCSSVYKDLSDKADRNASIADKYSITFSHWTKSRLISGNTWLGYN